MVLSIYHQQSLATSGPNFNHPPKEYRSDATSHPLLQSSSK
jgi:hypothetical protein